MRMKGTTLELLCHIFPAQEELHAIREAWSLVREGFQSSPFGPPFLSFPKMKTRKALEETTGANGMDPIRGGCSCISTSSNFKFEPFEHVVGEQKLMPRVCI